MKAIILAAGNATRYGKNKLLADFNNIPLICYNLNFCLQNDIKDVLVTISKNAVEFTELGDIYHPVKHAIEKYNFCTLKGKLNISYKFQDPTKYGPAAGLLPWADEKEETVILFGDNYLNGTFDKMLLEEYNAVATYKYLPYDATNSKRFAAIVDNNIVEKPHDINEGNFFIGFMWIAKNTLYRLHELKPSVRNEYEITEFFNSLGNTFTVPIFEYWNDLTYPEDDTKMLEIIQKSAIYK